MSPDTSSNRNASLPLDQLLLRLVRSRLFIPLLVVSSSQAADNLVPNGGFESGFTGWTRWGQNASIITSHITVVAEMRYIEELHYPLMFVRSVHEE